MEVKEKEKGKGVGTGSPPPSPYNAHLCQQGLQSHPNPDSRKKKGGDCPGYNLIDVDRSFPFQTFHPNAQGIKDNEKESRKASMTRK